MSSACCCSGLNFGCSSSCSRCCMVLCGSGSSSESIFFGLSTGRSIVRSPTLGCGA